MMCCVVNLAASVGDLPLCHLHFKVETYNTIIKNSQHPHVVVGDIILL